MCSMPADRGLASGGLPGDGDPRRVLGVDPGLTRCGVGVVEGVVGRPPSLVAVGVVRTPADADLAHRLLALEVELTEWVTQYRPHVVAVERVFAQHNLASVTGTAQASGIALLVAARHAIPVVLHTPSEVKAAVTGSGRADKAQVGAMVARVLRLSAPPRPADAADAVALAITHLWRGIVTNRYSDLVAQHGVEAGPSEPGGSRARTSARGAAANRQQPAAGSPRASAVPTGRRVTGVRRAPVPRPTDPTGEQTSRGQR